MAELRAAVALAPSEPNLHFGIGYIHWTHHDDDEAEPEFLAETKIDPTNAKAWAWLGDIQLRHHNDPAAARKLLEKALSIDANIRIAHLDLGIVMTDTKEFDGATTHLNEAIRLDPSKPDAHSRLAAVYRQVGKRTEAAAELAIVKQLNQKPEDSLLKVSGDSAPSASPKPAPPR